MINKTKNHKLVYILNSYSKNESSHFYHVLNLLSVMASEGVDVALIIEKSVGKPHFEQPNIVVEVLSSKGLFRYVELFNLLKNYHKKGYKHTYIRIASITTIVANIAARLSGASTFFWQSGTTHEWDWQQPFSLKKVNWFIKSYVPSYLARKVTTYFVTGPEPMIDYYHEVVGVDREKIKLLYNDIDLNRFAFSDIQKADAKSKFLNKQGFSNDVTILLVVHRLSPVRKTTLYFPGCLERLSEAGKASKFLTVVAGGGAELPEIKSMFESLSLDKSSCIFLGEVPNSEIQYLYQVADVFLHPTYNEGFPRVMLEAMASGLPVVSTNAGGTECLVGPLQKKMISDKTDPIAFADNLIALLKNDELRKSISSENLQWVKRFSTKNIVKMYKKVIFNDN